MVQEKEKSKIVDFDNEKLRRREKRRRDLERREDKFEKGVKRKNR
jgi:hypothetical protein